MLFIMPLSFFSALHAYIEPHRQLINQAAANVRLVCTVVCLVYALFCLSKIHKNKTRLFFLFFVVLSGILNGVRALQLLSAAGRTELSMLSAAGLAAAVCLFLCLVQAASTNVHTCQKKHGGVLWLSHGYFLCLLLMLTCLSDLAAVIVQILCIRFLYNSLFFHREKRLVSLGQKEFLENADAPVFIFNTDEELLYHNQASRKLLSLFDLEEKTGKSYRLIFNPAFFTDWDSPYIRNKINGDYYHFQKSPITDSRGRQKGFNVVLTDIKALNEDVKKLEAHIFTDPLCGCGNRAFYNLKSAESITDEQLPVAVFVADIDGLKKINDTFGHSSGDALIRTCAGILTTFTRNENLLFRYGGDEFVFFIYNADEVAANRIIDEIDRACRAQNFLFAVSISIGFSVAYSMFDSYKAHFTLADKAMYLKKSLKKGGRAGHEPDRIIP